MIDENYVVATDEKMTKEILKKITDRLKIIIIQECMSDALVWGAERPKIFISFVAPKIGLF